MSGTTPIRERIASWFTPTDPTPIEEQPMTDDTAFDAPEHEAGSTAPGSVDTDLREGGVLDAGPVRRLRIRVSSGEVDVIGRDEPGARIEVHEAAGHSLPVHLEDGLLRIGAERLLGTGARAVVTVTVQRDAEVEVDGTSAAILVSGMKHGLRIHTVSGDVVCDATAGQARVEGVSAELGLREHEGPIELTTVSGPATASGPVTRFEATGVSGDLFLDLEAPDRVDVRTVSGETVLRLGAERPAEYTISSVSGSLHLDGAEIGRLLGGYRGTWGTGDAGATRVKVESSSGTVRIVHVEDE
jgi:hypothetical protein